MRVFPKLGVQITAIFLVIFMLSSTVLADAQPWGGSVSGGGGDAATAIVDAQRDAATDANGGLWFIAGCLGGFIGLIIAYAIEPSPPATRLLGKSPDYVARYSDEYRKDVRGTNTKMAWIGCGLGALVAVIIDVIILANANNNTTTTTTY